MKCRTKAPVAATANYEDTVDVNPTTCQDVMAAVRSVSGQAK